MDFAQARMYSNKLGRFQTPDDFFNDSDIKDPQSWAKYVYVRNNPLNLTDPTGKCTPTKGNPCLSVKSKGRNNVPKQPNREMIDIIDLGFKDGPTGGHALINVESKFAEGDTIDDYLHVRTAIFYEDEKKVIRNGDEENPSKDQTAIEGNSRFVTDSPGLNTKSSDTEGNVSVLPKTALENRNFVAVFVVGEYNKKTKQLSENIIYYGVHIAYGKNGKIDKEKSKVFILTREQFIELSREPEHSDPTKLLRPPN